MEIVRRVDYHDINFVCKGRLKILAGVSGIVCAAFAQDSRGELCPFQIDIDADIDAYSRRIAIDAEIPS